MSFGVEDDKVSWGVENDMVSCGVEVDMVISCGVEEMCYLWG